ncbi:hypothetical protein SAMN05444339_10753 [Loktanella atrilutea]|uniref:Uncharacterized protein n=1 Tax=Loktanella atrilutea TaxID=366533 RepID=A0A1M5C7J6_LOKAT|nr:hypothetical protein [Loktanella atrilutea]SHF50754.1 hypothetical protein SAMN05444339_10753 [Loktanella atrilutea]
MTTTDFEDAVAELLHNIYAASPAERALAAARSRQAIVAIRRSGLPVPRIARTPNGAAEDGGPEGPTVECRKSAPH